MVVGSLHFAFAPFFYPVSHNGNAMITFLAFRGMLLNMEVGAVLAQTAKALRLRRLLIFSSKGGLLNGSL